MLSKKKKLSHKIQQWLRYFFKNPFSVSFYTYDRIYDSFILPFLGKVWRLEGQLRGANLGKGLFLGRPLFKFHPDSHVALKDGYSLVSSQRRCSSGNLYSPCRIQTHSPTASIQIDEGVGLNGTSIVARSCSIFIGKNSMIAPNCIIMDSPFHRLWPPDQRQNYSESDLDKDVFIGENCWIGTGCIILPGSRIGKNSVIGARSIVTGEIPENCLAIGSPAKVIRTFL